MQCQRNGDEKKFLQTDILLIDAMALVNQIQLCNLQGKHKLEKLISLYLYAVSLTKTTTK